MPVTADVRRRRARSVRRHQREHSLVTGRPSTAARSTQASLRAGRDGKVPVSPSGRRRRSGDRPGNHRLHRNGGSGASSMPCSRSSTTRFRHAAAAQPPGDTSACSGRRGWWLALLAKIHTVEWSHRSCPTSLRPACARTGSGLPAACRTSFLTRGRRYSPGGISSPTDHHARRIPKSSWRSPHASPDAGRLHILFG